MPMESLDYWCLCDELSVIQAALLVAGREPSSDAEYIAEKTVHKPIGYEAAKAAISNALRRGAIKGKLIPIYEYDINGNICGEAVDSIDIYTSRIEVESLREWLNGRGLKS